MADPVITLTTDFGTGSPYVAALKGVILAINSSTQLIDLSHEIPPQDLRHASFFLASTIPLFPPGAIHVVVVDPGVGSNRFLLYVGIRGQHILVPDNGCWTELVRRMPGPFVVRRLTEPGYWRQPVSRTFHGRDILGPVAGWLSRGLRPESLGPEEVSWVHLNMPEPLLEAKSLRGEVIFIDRFGNLITNLPGQEVLPRKSHSIKVGEHFVNTFSNAYSDVEPGTLTALISSTDRLEITVNMGNAAAFTNAVVGTAVMVSLLP